MLQIHHISIWKMSRPVLKVLQLLATVNMGRQAEYSLQFFTEDSQQTRELFHLTLLFVAFWFPASFVPVLVAFERPALCSTKCEYSS